MDSQFPNDYYGRDGWMKEMVHEKLYRFPSGFRVRWCTACKTLHGYLYNCKHFSKETQAIIRKEDFKKKAKLGISIALVVIFVYLLSIV